MLLTRDDFVYFERLQVRRSEVDAQAVVFNANYLTYLDTALSGYWRALALPREATLQTLQGDVLPRQIDLDFHAPAQAGDWLDVGLRCDAMARSSITMQGAIFCGDRLLLSGIMVCTYVDARTGQPHDVPERLRTVFDRFEATETVLQTRVAAWADLQVPARSVREAVFVQEQGIAREDEWDDADRDAVHAVVFNGLGQPVATGRLLCDGDSGVAHIGRMAVLRSLRGGGHGAAIMRALERAAQDRGIKALQLNAQQSASFFYQRLGYVAEGEPFDEVGLAHISMRKVLAS